MKRPIFSLVLAAVALTGCAPTPVQAPKVDVAAEAWYAPMTERLTAMDRAAEQLFQGGKIQEAAAIITSAQSLQTRLLSAPRPTLAAMEAIADLDQIYGKMLVHNGFFGEARLLFQKNVTRWRVWKPQSPETEMRLKQAHDAIVECDRHMGA